MDESVRPTIEKIKLQEQDNEIKLREKRELNAVILSLNRAIHEASMSIEKLSKEYESLISVTDKLHNEAVIERIRHSVLTDQVNACRKELAELQKASFNGISCVWEKRSKFFETVHSVSEKCDIWALLIKPTYEIKSNVVPHIQNSVQIVPDDTKLKAAIERRNEAIAMRNYLLSEPDVGEEFIRTRNALQYSMEIMNEQNN